ncbi:branched-chain amino acid ABC transporter permease [Desulfovibrio litoralis]|uniref:Amino acid/amide ABC transporter membrane protein 2, HAAT family n=1 Tax=Desulfovibrio litoralis DSM 11393 TaxID=1121455 RepID=A0A1M7T614_9BACT|nr:branched-chain amino acid ABC transporter permease [Desulfovibrio litoralis]SHN66184.1 amino acid/amide ABC transporter membrane protein 2, HAAT family [Desulfovibrio litoralis DSM 11393]
MSQIFNNQKILYAGYIIFWIGILLFPQLTSAYHTDVLNSVGMYISLALSLNLILGQSGLFHMGHTAFYAVGAYVTGILATQYGFSIIQTLPFAGICAAILAFLLARPIIHLRGDYFLIVTIGIVEIVRITLTNDIGGLTGGANGIFGIAKPVLFGIKISKTIDFYYLIWFFVGLSILVFASLNNSRFGRALNYIREDETAAAGSGINTTNYKLLAFVIGAFWAGLCGTIFASKMSIISPGSFSFDESVKLFAIVILGGSGSIRGVILGSFLIIGLPELFRDLESARMLFFGLAMVVMMIFRPQGLLPERMRKYNVKNLVGIFPCMISLKNRLDTNAQRTQTIQEKV